jgi:predicted ATPase
VNTCEVNEYTLSGLSKINVVLGKNGCGKSTVLRQVETDLSTETDDRGLTRYVTPERGGSLTYDAGVEQNITNSPGWVQSMRRANQFPQFKNQTITQFRTLETLVHRAAEEAQVPSDFGRYVERINGLLDQVEVRRDGATFRVFARKTDEPVAPASVSSGETELIALGIEALIFPREMSRGKDNLLLLDEPDVHLHPDLQARLMDLLKELVTENEGLQVIIATHSTAILGALADFDGARIAFMRAGDHDLQFHPIDAVYKKVLPVFGAHPLSNVFNSAPVLLVEGEDDERVWQQAVRTAEGSLKLYPVSCDGTPAMNAYEAQVKVIVDSVYDDATAYSLRDRNGGAEQIEDMPPVTRLRLSCRAAENLLLSDEVLTEAGMAWEDVKAGIDSWLAQNESHSRYAGMKVFKDGGYDRKSFDLKDLRMLFAGSILASNKPWEVLVGQTLGQLSVEHPADCSVEGSILNYLGPKVVESLIPAGKA